VVIASVTPGVTATEMADILRDFAMFDGDMSIDNTMIDHDENPSVDGVYAAISLSYANGDVVRYAINPNDMGEFTCETENAIAGYIQQEVDAGRTILSSTPYFESKFIPSPPANFCGDAIVDTTPYACDDGGTDDGDGCSAICEIEDPQPPYLIGLDTDLDGEADILDADLDGNLDLPVDVSCNFPIDYVFDLIADVPGQHTYFGGSMPQGMSLGQGSGRITYNPPCSDAGQSFVAAFNADNGPALAINFRVE